MVVFKMDENQKIIVKAREIYCYGKGGNIDFNKSMNPYMNLNLDIPITLVELWSNDRGNGGTKSKRELG